MATKRSRLSEVFSVTLPKKAHHPDYDPDVACGSLYVQHEVAVQMMLAIAYSLRHNPDLSDLDKQRLCVAATVINDVFSLGAEEVSDD